MRPMSEIERLLTDADAYAEQINRSRVTVSKRLFGYSRALDNLHRGGTCTVASLERARERLDALRASVRGDDQSQMVAA